MTTQQKCEHCRYFIPNKCRYNPPVVVEAQWDDEEESFADIVSAWPVVFTSDWCGRFQPGNHKRAITEI